MSFLEGYRTTVGGLMMVGLGAFLMATGRPVEGAKLVAAGITVIGGGAKVEKLVTALRALHEQRAQALTLVVPAGTVAAGQPLSDTRRRT